MNKSCSCLNYPQSHAKKALFCKNAFIFALSETQKLRRPKNSFCPVLFSKKAFQNKQHISCSCYYTTAFEICQHILCDIFAPTLDIFTFCGIIFMKS